MTRVLILCTHNSARSQMAEAFLRRYGGERFTAYSAGLNPSTINPFTVQVMEELGFDPGSAPFGLYAFWPGNPFFDARTTYTEDALNTFPNALPHHVRTYPLVNPDGSTEPSAYIVATNEFHLGGDFNDLVLVLRNVQPAATP